VIYASPWSPPAFMKNNNNMLRGGKLLPGYYDSWALYYTKFIKAYEKEGLGDSKIMIWDHNRDLINHRANVFFEDPEASKHLLLSTLQQRCLVK